MDVNSFTANFADAIEVDASRVMPDTVFKELPEWDSLAALNVIAMVDELLGKTIAGDDLAQANTVGDLWERASR